MSGFYKKVSVAETTESNSIVAFVNWSLLKTDGSFIKASRGFPIFQNPRYPNYQEDLLVKLAKEHGGSMEVTMRCRVVINKAREEHQSIPQEMK